MIYDFYAGLDLGQTTDYTALAIMEEPPPGRPILVEPARLGWNPRPARWKQAEPPIVPVRHLQRWPLGTTYPAIVADVQKMLNTPPLAGRKTALVVDATGVGRAVVDMFGALVTARISIHGGAAVTIEGREYHVPKRDLIGVLQVGLQEGRLAIAEQLLDAQTLVQELLSYQVTISETAHDSYDARSGKHDDLILALAIAAWFRQHARALPPPRPPTVSYSFNSYG